MQESVPPSAHTGHHGSFGRILSWCFALLLGVAAGMAIDDWILPEPSTQQDYAPQVAMQQLQQQLLQEQQVADTLRGQLQVEQGAIKGLEDELQKMQQEKSRLGEQLAFYETLLPPGPQGTISIRAFDVEMVGPLLRYKVLLQRSMVNGKPFDGAIYFTAEGQQDGKPATITLEEATAELPEGQEPESTHGVPTAGKTQFPLSFEQFNRDQGWLVVPDGFEIRSLTMSVLEGKTVRASRKVELNTTEATSGS
ncbi:DUF6776 family protein [Paenalcaligenes suwonensis]|uniref:DUF6776 family protein n=1 Tax=Paenalcaligenes suwonensis TaxID=1202713 RepID=UPI00140D0D69|nr:DUF6776 family protein [Paenalcaligenes suwonensis]NHC60747.1 hypothetical protein [Paenalcaligenes suwonensis]